MSAGNRGYEYRLRLGHDAAGVPLLEYLARRYPGTAESDWLDRIGAGRVLLDGVPVASDTLLAPGRELTWSRPPWKEPRVPLDYAILHLDAHLLAVAKPAGLPTMPGGGLFMEHTLLALVRRRFPHANPLHRLGRGTSGVVLFALTKEAFARVSSLWGGGRTLKLYRALASGLPDRDMFEIDVPIGPVPHALLGTVHAAHPAGKRAHSRVRVLERRAGAALVEVEITTGRPHQIRIHLAAAGHPLVGDPLYGPGGVPPAGCRALPGDLGYHLHHQTLAFPHPADARPIEITCAPPPLLRSS